MHIFGGHIYPLFEMKWVGAFTAVIDASEIFFTEPVTART
jgi:hypothetical protein